ncbi:MAG TPA: hypothetical protein VJR46_07440 [Candidatus Dormibacteraeota bacterium]|nr:hypothetical protein [Candidatus Dormibacteraeota bacterium]
MVRVGALAAREATVDATARRRWLTAALLVMTAVLTVTPPAIALLGLTGVLP